MLTMADISLVKVRSKQVELSYCHSANGQIRSVLVALWAILDSAIELTINKLKQQYHEVLSI